MAPIMGAGWPWAGLRGVTRGEAVVATRSPPKSGGPPGLASGKRRSRSFLLRPLVFPTTEFPAWIDVLSFCSWRLVGCSWFGTHS